MTEDERLKEKLCVAGRKAVRELIKIAESEIIMDGAEWTKNDDGDMVISGLKGGADLPADKLTRAAQAKKIAITEAFDILERINLEEKRLEEAKKGEDKENQSAFNSERRAKKVG